MARGQIEARRCIVRNLALVASALEAACWKKGTNQMNCLEDFHQDILGKAMRGLGIGKNDMAHRIGTEREEIEGILKGAFDEGHIRQWHQSYPLMPIN